MDFTLKRPLVVHIDEPRPRLASSTSPFRTDAPRSGFGCEFCGRFTLQHDMQHMAGTLRRVGRVRTPVCKDDRADRHHRPNLDQTWNVYAPGCVYAPAAYTYPALAYTLPLAFTHTCAHSRNPCVYARWAAYTQQGPRKRRKCRVYAAWDPSMLERWRR